MKKLTVDIVISFIYFVFCSLWKASQHHLIYILDGIGHRNIHISHS